MPALLEPPNDNSKSGNKNENIITCYTHYSINELLDERNYLKKNGFNYEDIDLELKSRV